MRQEQSGAWQMNTMRHKSGERWRKLAIPIVPNDAIRCEASPVQAITRQIVQAVVRKRVARFPHLFLFAYGRLIYLKEKSQRRTFVERYQWPMKKNCQSSRLKVASHAARFAPPLCDWLNTSSIPAPTKQFACIGVNAATAFGKSKVASSW